MLSDESPGYNFIDISIKRLVRENPAAFLQLAGFTVGTDHVTFEDIAIQQRELRADHICILTNQKGAMRGVIYLEYQLIPNADLLEDWISKWASLLTRFPVPVVLLVVYLHRGNYATFHQEYRARLDGFETAVQFNTFRFWECAPQIRSGEYPDFVPLLTLCEDHPTEATVREQVALIQDADLAEERKQELLSLSFLVASRDISWSILLGIVKEIFTMKTLPPIVEDMFGDLLRERERVRIQEAEKLAEERGEKRGEEIGEVVGTRMSVLRLYTKRLGVPPAQIVARLESIDNIETLYAMLDRFQEPMQSWEQLLPSGDRE